jgi:hypothetical protein
MQRVLEKLQLTRKKRHSTRQSVTRRTSKANGKSIKRK